MKPWIFDGWLPLLGHVSIPGYYFWLVASWIGCVFVVTREARHSNVAVKYILDLALIALVGGLVGARLGWIVTVKPGLYLQDPLRLFMVWKGGFVYYGGFLFVTAAMWLYIRWRKLDFWQVGDIYAPGLGFGIFLGRMACYSAGCCYGRPADFPLGVPVPWGVTFFGGQVPEALEGIPLHPTQLYTSLVGLVMFLVAMRVRKRSRYDGQAFLWVVAVYAVGRTLVEVFRFDAERGVYWGWLSTSMIISVPLLAGAVIGMTLLQRRAAAPADAQEA